MNKKTSTRFWLYHAFTPFLIFALLSLLFDLSPLDLTVSDRFYDFQAGLWPSRDSWWAEHLIHRGGRKFVLFVALGSLAVWGLSFLRMKMRPWRRAALYLALSIGLGTGLVTLGKAMINRHCPWDYDRYGGPVPYVSLFESTVPGCKKGGCFPAGHASGGFSLMSIYFIFYVSSRRKAMFGLLVGLGLGTLFGFAQVVRGAHFLSHNIWTAAVCWFSALILYTWPFRSRLFPAEVDEQE